MFDQSIFCERIKSLRLKKGLNQEELGKNFNFSKQAISDLERGYRTTTIDKIVEIAVFFDVSIDYLVGLTDDPHRN